MVWLHDSSSGEKSFAMLMGDGYGINVNGGDYGNKEAPVQTSVLSFLRSGNYYWSNGNLYNRTSGGYYWSSRAISTATTSYYLHFYSTSLNFMYSNYKCFGFTLRCVICLFCDIIIKNKEKL